MINFAYWMKQKYFGYKDESTRFIVKNIKPYDVLVFDNLTDWCRSKHDLMYSIKTQCGTTSKERFDCVELARIESSIFNSIEFSLEELSTRGRIDNMVLFGFEKYRPKLIRDIISYFSTRCSILAVSNANDSKMPNILNRVNFLKNSNMNQDQIYITMVLENEFHPITIKQALMSVFTKEKYNVRMCKVLDNYSDLWT